MKRYTLLFIFLFSFTAFSQGKPPHQCGNHSRFDKKFGHNSLRYFKECGVQLTDKQVNKIYDIALKYLSEEEPFRAEIEKIDFNIRSEIIKSNPDKNLLKKLVFQKKEVEASIDYIHIERDLSILDVLTSEQRSMLKNNRKRN